MSIWIENLLPRVLFSQPKLEVPNIEMMDTSPIHDSIVMDEIYSHPFKMVGAEARVEYFYKLLAKLLAIAKKILFFG